MFSFRSSSTRNRVNKAVRPSKRSVGEQRSKLKMQQKLDSSMTGRYDNALQQQALGPEANTLLNGYSTMISPIITL